LTHPAIIKTTSLVHAGDLAGAERALMAVAETEGDYALVTLLDEVPPKDLLAIMREFDSSKESPINLLVTPEQFARAVVLDVRYGDRTHEQLRGMMNAVLFRDPEETSDFLSALGEVDGGFRVLANYFLERRAELREFSVTGNFVGGTYGRLTIRPDLEDESNDLSERLDADDASDSYDPDEPPKVKRVEIADNDWMETAWVLRYEVSEVFEELLQAFRREQETVLNELSAMLGNDSDRSEARANVSSDDEESAL